MSPDDKTIQKLKAQVKNLQRQITGYENLEAQVKDLQEQVVGDEKLVSQLKELIEKQQLDIQDLADMNRRLLRWRFGRRTEKSTDPQTTIPELEAFLEALKDDAPRGEKSTITRKAIDRGDPPKEKPRRRLLSETHPNLSVEEIVHDLAPEDRFDEDGTVLVCMGEEVKEELVEEPGRYYIVRHVRKRYGRSDTGEKKRIAPAPPQIVTRGILANMTILLIVVRHVVDCLPFHRQCEIYSRSGITISRQTITNAFHAYARLAKPLMDVIKNELLQSALLHIDGSFVYQQDPKKRKRKCQRSPIYVATDGEQMLVQWRETESHQDAADLIPGYSGYLIRDEWDGWYKMDLNQVTHVACNAHARRYFAEMMDTDPEARHMVGLFSKLYAVEKEANASGLTGTELASHRLCLRQQFSVTIMDEIRDYATTIANTATGRKASKARYILNHQERLREFLTNGNLPPDNNLAERVLRRNAMLRNNRPFFVAKDGGENLAIAQTLTGSCRLLGIDPVAYLDYALPALFAYRTAKENGTDLPDLSAYTPKAYAKNVAQAVPGVIAA